MVWRKAAPCGIAGGAILVLFLAGTPAAAQVAGASGNEGSAQSLEQSVKALAQQVQQLNATISQLQTEVSRSRQETREMRHELEGALGRLAMVEGTAPQKETAPIAGEKAGGPSATSAANPPSGQAAVSERVSKLEDNQELLRAKVDDQYQTKVESESKYRLRLSGIALLNAFENSGHVDNQDVPNLARGRGTFDTTGSFGATARQSELGFEVYGPTFAGARTSADLRIDLFGGFPNTSNGITEGLMRLRTATVRMDWDRTSIVVGQDAAFFSPLSPTSIASLGYPAFSYSGNLWTWTPQVLVEHHLNFANSNSLTLQ